MWSKTTRRYYIVALQSASRYFAAPYDWNPTKERIEMKTKTGQFYWKVNVMLQLCLEVFVIYRMVEMHVRDVGTAKERISMKYTTVAYFLPLVFEFATWVRWEEYPLFVNCSMKLASDFQDNFVKSKTMMGIQKWRAKSDKDENHETEVIVKNRCDPYIRYIFYIGRTVLTLQSVSIFTRPEQRFLLTSLWKEPKSLPWAIRLPIALFHLQMVWSLCFKMQLYTFTALAHLSPTALMLQFMRSGYMQKSAAAQENFLRFYSQIQLTHSMFNRIFGKVEFPFTKGDLLTVATLSIYGAIKLNGLRAVILSVIAAATTVTLKILYQSMADLTELSDEVIRSWKFVATQKSVLAKLKAMHPLRTRVGNLYTVPKSVVPIIMFIILDRTITLLLTF